MKYTVALALFATVAAYDNVILADGDDEKKEDDEKKGDDKKKTEEKTPAAFCTFTSVKTYSDAKCTKDEKALDAAALKKFNEGKTKDCVDGDSGSVQLTCDTTSAKTTTYKEAKCKAGTEDATKSVEVKWTECSKLTDSLFVKATGAKALLAGAAAALAFVGSQF